MTIEDRIAQLEAWQRERQDQLNEIRVNVERLNQETKALEQRLEKLRT